jgi:hypothetical protein
MDCAEFADGPAHQILYRFFVGKVEMDRDRAPTGVRDLVDGRLGTFDVDVTDGDHCSLAGKAFGGSGSDPGRSSGNNERFAI